MESRDLTLDKCYTDGQRHKPNALMPTSHKGEIMLPFYKAVMICHEYETVGVLCSISGDKNGNIELFTAIDSTTCSHILSRLCFDYTITEELLRRLIQMSFEDIKRRKGEMR